MSRGNLKPQLTGVRIKTRKSAAKAQAKVEPSVFREKLFGELRKAPNDDFDKLGEILQSAGSTLNYSKNADTLLDILFVGGIESGGSFDCEDLSPFSIFQAKNPPSFDDVEKRAGVLTRLMRGHPYLRTTLEEHTIPNLLGYTRKWSDDELQKLALAVGLLLTSAGGLAPLQKDAFTPDFTAAKVLAVIFGSYLKPSGQSPSGQSMESLAALLRRAKLTDLSKFFPQNHRTDDEVVHFFKERDLSSVADWYKARKQALAKEALKSAVVHELANDEWREDESKIDDIISTVRDTLGEFPLPATDVIGCIWPCFSNTIKWQDNSGKIVPRAASEVEKFTPVLAAFSQGQPRVQIALINAVQLYCYENNLVPVFLPILKVLYNKDCIIDDPIFKWHSKEAINAGRVQFLKAADPLVQFLRESDSEEE